MKGRLHYERLSLFPARPGGSFVNWWPERSRVGCEANAGRRASKWQLMLAEINCRNQPRMVKKLKRPVARVR